MSDKHYLNSAIEYYHKQMYAEAIIVCKEHLDDSCDSDTWYLIGCCLYELKDFNLAMSSFHEAILCNPKCADAFFMLGNVFLEFGEKDNALKFWQESLSINPKNAIVLTNIAGVYLEMQEFELSMVYANRAIGIDKNYIDAYRCLQRISQKNKNMKLFKFYLRKILQINKNDPVANFDYSYVCFLENNFKKGLYHYEFRKKLPERLSKYNFLSLDDKSTSKATNLLIYHEQGFGDNIQFARFFKKLKNKKVSCAIQNSLNRLFQYSFPNIEMIDNVDTTMGFDACVSLMSIPYKLNLSDFDNEPYLSVKIDDIKKFRRTLTRARINIGICWKGSALNKSNLNPKDFEKLFGIENVNFYSFQVENETESKTAIKELGSSFIDFYDTAVAAMSMDIMITIDTAVAHLCGALGVKTFVLVTQDIIDWRWQTDNNRKSLWYKNTAVFKYLNEEDFLDNIENIYSLINQELSKI